MGHNLHLAGYPAAHIFGGILEHLIDVDQLHLGFGAYLGEALGNDRQPLHVFIHIRQQRGIDARGFQQVHPGHERRDGRTQLVGRLLRQSHPHLVLFGLFRTDESKVDDEHKQYHHPQLHIGIEREALQQNGVVVVKILFLIVAQVDFDDIRAPLQVVQFPLQVLFGVGFGQTQIDILVYLAVPVDQNRRYRGVALDYLQDELHAHLGLVAGQLTGSLGPYLHLLALLDREVFHQVVRDIQHTTDQQNRNQQEYQLALLADIINILHSYNRIYIRTTVRLKYYLSARPGRRKRGGECHKNLRSRFLLSDRLPAYLLFPA